MPSLAVQKLYEDAIVPSRAHDDDVGLDLYAYVEKPFDKIYPGDTKAVGTGIAVDIPRGYAGYVQSRSGLALDESIFVLNSPGLIDPGYTGEVKVILHCALDSQKYKYNIHIKKGQKIAQLVIVPAPKFDPVIVDSLEETERGKKGFGSTDAR